MKKTEHWIMKTESLMALLLIGLFAVCILSVLLTGADVYQRLTGRDQRVYETRTTAQYLTTKIRQADVDGSLKIEESEGIRALTITESIEGMAYKTWIYRYDGYMREFFAAEEAGLLPEAGEKILVAEALEFQKKASGICVKITGKDGQVQELFLDSRSGKEVSG